MYVFAAGRMNRNMKNPESCIERKRIIKTTNTKYTEITLNFELRFLNYITTRIDRSLKKLQIIKSLCSTDLRSPMAVRTTYS